MKTAAWETVFQIALRNYSEEAKGGAGMYRSFASKGIHLCLHFVVEKTEAHEGCMFCQGHTLRTWQCWALSQDLFTSITGFSTSGHIILKKMLKKHLLHLDVHRQMNG